MQADPGLLDQPALEINLTERKVKNHIAQEPII
jgi:hypothetical protein